MKTAITHIILFFLLFLSSCLPDTPATSSISIDFEGMKLPVNQELYGVTLEEINHAIDGGLYAEMVQNGSFEANVPPLNCPYDRRTNELITPNGYRIPFLRPDSIPGWESLSATTYFALDAAERINERNRRSLLLTIGADSLRGRGGVKAEGFGGMAIRKAIPFFVLCEERFGVSLPPARGAGRFLGASRERPFFHHAFLPVAKAPAYVYGNG